MLDGFFLSLQFRFRRLVEAKYTGHRFYMCSTNWRWHRFIYGEKFTSFVGIGKLFHAELYIAEFLHRNIGINVLFRLKTLIFASNCFNFFNSLTGSGPYLFCPFDPGVKSRKNTKTILYAGINNINILYQASHISWSRFITAKIPISAVKKEIITEKYNTVEP